MATVYLGLGSNLGDREQNLTEAVELLARRVRVEQVSSVYETAPVGYKDQPWFLNAVCRVSASLSPEQVLALAREIEAALGRVRSFPNAPRTIDVDVLFYGNEVVNTPQLTVPHPRLAERAFVLVPLAELAPELVHPLSGKTVMEMMEGVDMAGIHKWKRER